MAGTTHSLHAQSSHTGSERRSRTAAHELGAGLTVPAKGPPFATGSFALGHLPPSDSFRRTGRRRKSLW